MKVNNIKPSRYHLLKPFIGVPLICVYWLMHYIILNLLFPKLYNINKFQESFLFFLLIIPSFLPSTGYGLLTLNFIFYLIKPIRDTFEEEARIGVITKPIIQTGHKTYSESQKELFKLTYKYLIPIGYGFVITGIIYYIILSKLY